MILGICLVILLILGVTVFFLEGTSCDDAQGIIALLMFILAIVLACALLFPYQDLPLNKEVTLIKSLSTSVTTEGHMNGAFTLMYGVINGTAYYYSYAVDGNGYKLVKIEAENVKIIEDNSNPRIERYTTNSSFKSLWPHTSKDYPYDLIYLPKGSIIQSYDPNIK